MSIVKACFRDGLQNPSRKKRRCFRKKSSFCTLLYWEQNMPRNITKICDSGRHDPPPEPWPSRHLSTPIATNHEPVKSRRVLHRPKYRFRLSREVEKTSAISFWPIAINIKKTEKTIRSPVTKAQIPISPGTWALGREVPLTMLICSLLWRS